MNLPRPLAALLALGLLAGCASQETLETVDQVDLERFMGDWYVIAHIPTFIEDEAYNAVESYELDGDRIATTFTFRNKGFDGEEKRYEPNAVVRNTETNAVWGMQFVWPFRSDFRIVYLDEDYGTTIIGRNARDYVWIMARGSEIGDSKYRELVRLVGEMGYDVSELRVVPQRWP